MVCREAARRRAEVTQSDMNMSKKPSKLVRLTRTKRNRILPVFDKLLTGESRKRRGLAVILALICIMPAVVACTTSRVAPTIENPPGTGTMMLPDTGDRPVIAYALGSGAARGFAHVGVLSVLDEAGIYPDLIVGTSSGSVVGAFYAGGIRGEDLTQMALNIDPDEIIDYTASRRGVIIGKSLEKFVNDKLDYRLLQDLDIPLAVVSTDLRYGKKVVFTQGNTGLAVRAASSFPGLFRPVIIGDREYVDGGVLSPVPVQAAIDLGADIVIAVDVAKSPSPQAEIDGWIDVLHQSYLIMARAMSATETREADIIIKPDIGDMSLLQFEQRQRAIDAGAEAARKVLPGIEDLIKRKTLERI